MEEVEQIKDLCDDLDELVGIIRSGLREARSLKNYEARENKLAFLEDRILRAKTVYESLQLELRSQGKNNPATKRFRDQARDYKVTINELIQETNDAKAEQGGIVQSTEQIMLQHSEKFTTGQLLQQGISVQEKSIESLERQLRMIEESKELAVQTLGELARQEEQLLRITADVTTVQENLKYAGRQLRSLARRMAGDWAFRICCLLVLILVIIIIIIVAVVPPEQLNAIFTTTAAPSTTTGTATRQPSSSSASSSLL